MTHFKQNIWLVNVVTSTPSLIYEEYIPKTKNGVDSGKGNIELRPLMAKNLNKPIIVWITETPS